MRRIVIGIAAGALAFAGSSATAADQEAQLEQLRQMQQQLEQLESRAEAAQDELAAVNQRADQQQELIETSGIGEARGASSGLASFLDTLEVGGWAAASYTYNFNDIDDDEDTNGGPGPGTSLLGGGNTGGGGFPFHPDSNTFSFDQLWFELEKPVSEDSRGGFRADLVFGKIADLLTDGGGDSLSGSDEDLELYQAYAQYLAPIGNGLKIQAGKFATTIGAEVAQQPYNFNITRGQVYNLFQPITHTGVMASMEANGASMAIGVTNDTVGVLDVDNNNNKNLLGHIGYAEDTWGVSVNGLFGSPLTGNERDKETIVDLILSFDPSESFSGYINATWREMENAYTVGASGFGSPCGNAASCRDADGWGVAAAGRFALSDRTGISLRGEWIEDSDSFFSQLRFAGNSGVPASRPGAETEMLSITGTVDHLLTEQLMLRVEARWDEVEIETVAAGGGLDEVFFDGSLGEDDQLVGIVEMIYNF